MQASMGPDYYQAPDMFTVASIQVLTMYYHHDILASMMVNSHDEDEDWPRRDPYIQLSSDSKHHVHPGNSKQPTFLLSGSTWTKLRFQNMFLVVCEPSNELLTGCNWLSKALSIQVTNSNNSKFTNVCWPAIQFVIELSKSF